MRQVNKVLHDKGRNPTQKNKEKRKAKLPSTRKHRPQETPLTAEMPKHALLLLIASSCYLSTNAFTLEMMGGRRGKGNLKRSLDDSSAVGDKRVKVASSGVASL